MNINLILENLTLFSSSPDGVESLRKLIYKLATSGALSDQKSNEKKPDFKATVGEGEIPNNWIWCELQEVAIFGGRGSIKPELIPEDSWLLDLEDIEKVSSKLLVRTHARDRRTTSNKAIFKEGDVLYGKLRPYLDKVLVADMPGYCTTEIVAIQPHDGLDPRWLRICLKRPEFISKVTELSYGTKMPRLGTDDAKKSLHPIPPLEEQRRIVAEVEKLLELCDQIEDANKYAQLINIDARRSAVDAISIAQTPEELKIAWQRIQDNWEVMTDTAESVSDLRRLIETFGVRGQLTEKMNLGDTAEDLLRDLGLSRDVFTINEIDIVPRNWAFTNLGAIIQLEYGKSLPKQIRSTHGKIPVYGSNGIIGYHDEALIENGTIVVGRKGSIGQVNIARGESWVIDTAYYVAPKADMPIEYLALLIKTSNLQSLNKATAIPGLNRNDAYSQRCFIAPPEEQIRIVQTVNELLEVCDRLAEALQERENIALKFARSAVSESL